MLNAQRPTHDVCILQVLVCCLNRAKAVGSTLQKAGVAGTRIDVAAVDVWTLVPVDLSRHRCLHAIRDRCRRQWETCRPDIAYGWIGCNAGRTPRSVCINSSSAQLETAGI